MLAAMGQHEHPHEPDHAHERAEDFPRILLRDLVAEQQAGEERRARWQVLFLTLALALLALALPTERLLGRGPALVTAASGGAWLHPNLLIGALTRLLSGAPGLDSERASFLLSALCWAGAFPLLVGLALRAGSSRGLALTVSLSALLAPAPWLAATLPGPAAPGILGAAFVARSLLDEAAAPGRAAARSRILASFALACALDVSLLALLLVPVTVAARGAGRAADRADGAGRWRAGLPPWSGVIALFAWLLLLGIRAAEGWARARTLGIVDPAESPSWSAPVQLSLGLGIGLVAVLALLLPPASQHESRPPAWLLPWCLLPPFLQLATGSPAGAGLLPLVPALVLGAAYLLGRMGPSRAGLLAALLLPVQVAVTTVAVLDLQAGDPDRSWRERAVPRLEPDDVVVTLSSRRAYVLRERWRLDTLDASRGLQSGESLEAWWAREVEGRFGPALDAQRRWVVDSPLAPDDPERFALHLAEPAEAIGDLRARLLQFGARELDSLSGE